MNKLLRVFTLLALVTACSDGGNSVVPAQSSFLPIANPTVENPPDVGDISLLANSFDLADVGYQIQEYFVAGAASSFTNLSELGADGIWDVEAADQADYKTRIVVHRPIDPADFSGTVVVEWFNVSSGFDIPPSWGAGHVELYRSGHAWVGVSAQFVGIEGQSGGFPALPESGESRALWHSQSSRRQFLL